ncbi:hypothetical protein Tco_1196221 [Tanacetum coccineum]
MAAEGSTPPGLSELSDKVDPLASQLESVLEWIRCQPKPKTRETPLMEKFEDEASFKYDTKEDRANETHVTLKKNVGKHIPNFFQRNGQNYDRGRHTVATTISNEAIELGQVEEVDRSLTLMVKPTSGVTKEKEELFTLKIQVKQELIEAIVDTGSEKNLISSSLVERLGLETTPHPQPYSLGWIKKDVDTQVNRQCKFRFAITNQFIDEVTCEVVPLDICQVIFGSPYLWE